MQQYDPQGMLSSSCKGFQADRGTEAHQVTKCWIGGGQGAPKVLSRLSRVFRLSIADCGLSELLQVRLQDFLRQHAPLIPHLEHLRIRSR